MTGLDPHTSLAMTYLRAYIDVMPSKARRRARAKHALLMHWSACATDRASEPCSPRTATQTAEAQDHPFVTPDRLEGISGRQTISASGGHG